jgi:hypothetical protein
MRFVHASGSITSRYVHTLDEALVMAADTVSATSRRCWMAQSYRIPTTLSIGAPERLRLPASLQTQARWKTPACRLAA